MLSFVIPCYGSEKTIEFVVNEIHEVVSKKPQFDYEIITVNDSSPDNVLEVLKKLSEKNPNLKVVDLAKNFGKHGAVMAGLSKVSGDIIISLDDDGQCPMDSLWDLIDPILNDKADCTVAEYGKKKQSFFKNFGSKVNALMSRILINKPKEFNFSNFFAVKRYVVDEICKYENPYPYLEGLLLRTTKNISPVKMEERERYEGKGNFTFFRSLSLWINGFTAFSVKPLRIATVLGVLCALFGFGFGIYAVINKIINPNAPLGYSSLMAMIAFLGGAIMMLLGLIGEYVGRIYICLNKSPQYVIKETHNFDDKDKH